MGDRTVSNDSAGPKGPLAALRAQHDGPAEAYVVAAEIAARTAELTDALARDLEALRALLLDSSAGSVDAKQRALTLLADAALRAERARAILHDVELVSRAGRQPLQVVNVGEWLRSSVEMVAKESGTTAFTCEFDDQLRVLCNPVQLGQVFVHLLTNALEALHRDPRANPGIRVAAWRTADDQTVIEVSDTAKSLAAAELMRAFDACFTTKVHGSGLGLTLSRFLVGQWGGSITLESKSLRGASVRIVLPSRPPPTRVERQDAPA